MVPALAVLGSAQCLLPQLPLPQLEKVQRVAESEWTESAILPSVSFASLCTPTDKEMKDLLPVEFSKLRRGCCRRC